MKSLLALVAWLVPTALGVFVDEAYKVDYHHALLGFPQQHTTFFHQPHRESKASLIYTLSEHSFLGAINPKDGSIVWRQKLWTGAANATNSFLRSGEASEVVISGLNRQVAAWSASDGKLIWSYEHGTPGEIKDLEILEFPEGASATVSEDVIVLFRGKSSVVQRIDWKTGEVKWQYVDSGNGAPFQLSASATKIFYLSLVSSRNGLKIKVTSLDPSNGQKQDEYILSSDSEVSSERDIFYVGSNSASPIVAWADQAGKTFKVNILGTKDISSFDTLNTNSEKIEKYIVHAPRNIDAPPHFLVQFQTADAHWGKVYHIDLAKSKIWKKYDVPRLAGSGAISVSISEDKVYFTRIAKGAFVVLSSESHDVVDRHVLEDFGVPGLRDYPEPILAVAEVNRIVREKYAVRAALMLQSGDWVLILNGKGVWTRHEGLADSISAGFAELPRKEPLAQELAAEGHASTTAAYVHRLNRHLNSLQSLPSQLKALPSKLVNSFRGNDTEVDSKSDDFGFHKHIVMLTKHGRLVALDAANRGRMVWSVPIQGYKNSPDWEVPEVYISPHGIVRVKNKDAHSVYDTLTGKFLRKGTEKKANPKKKDLTTVTYDIVGEELIGFLGEGRDSPIWKFKPRDGERILNITSRPSIDPVASIGVVLGDRRVLYKYLNPNLALITAVSDSAGSVSFYLLDSVSGNVVHEVTHPNVDLTRPIPVVLSENWFCYSVTVDSTPGAVSRGYQLVISELYESPLPDDRGPLGAATNYSTLHGSGLTPHVRSQAFHIPEEISLLTVSQTRQGITSRLVLALLSSSGSLIGIPRFALDARRPVGRDPTNPEKEEGLFRYVPNFEFDPKWYLSHKRELSGIQEVITSPAVLESTSLVFAWGFDVFGTRVSPSFTFDVLGKEFNKLQMLATVLALAIAVLGIAPFVQRKQNNMRWQMI